MLGFLVAGFLIWWVVRMAGTGSAPVRADLPEAIDACFVATSERLDDERERQEAAKEERTLVAPAAAPPTALPRIGPIDPRWTRFPRRDVDLAALILSGDYEADDFVRHPLLNPGDVQIPVEGYQDLVGLVVRLLDGSRQFRTMMREVALEDRIAIVRGSREVVPSEPIDEAEWERRARAVAEMARGRGSEITIDEAKARLARGEAFSVRLRKDMSFIDGKVYRDSSFGLLTKYDSRFEQLRFVAAAEASLIVGWFVAYGYCPFSGEVSSIFARIQSMPSQEVARFRR